jgi:hypothetical protein
MSGSPCSRLAEITKKEHCEEWKEQKDGRKQIKDKNAARRSKHRESTGLDVAVVVAARENDNETEKREWEWKNGSVSERLNQQKAPLLPPAERMTGLQLGWRIGSAVRAPTQVVVPGGGMREARWAFGSLTVPLSIFLPECHPSKPSKAPSTD